MTLSSFGASNGIPTAAPPNASPAEQQRKLRRPRGSRSAAGQPRKLRRPSRGSRDNLYAGVKNSSSVIFVIVDGPLVASR